MAEGEGKVWQHGKSLDEMVGHSTSSELLDRLFLSSPAIGFFWKLDTGWPVSYVSPNVSQFGYSADQFESGELTFDCLIHPDDLERVTQEVEQCLSDGSETLAQQYRIRDSKGETRWISDFTRIERAPDGTPLWAQGILIDITEQYSSALRAKQISNAMPGAIFEYRLMPNGTDRIDYMSPGCEKIWEIGRESIQNDPSRLWGMVLPEDLPAMQNSVRRSAQLLTRWTHEWRIQPASGRIKWLRGSADPLREDDGSTVWNTVIVDITESKNTHLAVSEALKKTIYVLADAVEARDPYTAGHQQQVSKIAVLLGHEMGLNDHQLTGLELAAMIHDVGKIQVPSDILNKPAALSSAERELVKTHAAAGEKLLENIDMEWPIASIIGQHHERLDGSGYPRGLSGDQILLEARIIAVADTLESMATHRPYRAALGVQAAREELEAGAGKLYDAEIVEICLRLIDADSFQLDTGPLG